MHTWDDICYILYVFGSFIAAPQSEELSKKLNNIEMLKIEKLKEEESSLVKKLNETEHIYESLKNESAMSISQLKTKLKTANDAIDNLNSQKALEQSEYESFRSATNRKNDEFATEVSCK
jgi:uncharacterized protein YwgA